MESLKFLISLGVEARKSPEEVFSYVEYAVMFGHLPVLRELVNLGHRVHVPTTEEGVFTPFHRCIGHGSITIIKFLIDDGHQELPKGGMHELIKQVKETQRIEPDNTVYDYLELVASNVALSKLGFDFTA